MQASQCCTTNLKLSEILVFSPEWKNTSIEILHDLILRIYLNQAVNGGWPVNGFQRIKGHNVRIELTRIAFGYQHRREAPSALLRQKAARICKGLAA